MPLEILALLVVTGVSFVVVLTRLAFGKNQARIASCEAAVVALLLDYPDCEIDDEKGQNILIDQERRTCLIALKQPHAHLGYVQAFGSKHVTRLIGRDDIKNYRLHRDGVLRIHLTDFTLPRADLNFGKSQDGETARKLLDEIMND